MPGSEDHFERLHQVESALGRARSSRSPQRVGPFVIRNGQHEEEAIVLAFAAGALPVTVPNSPVPASGHARAEDQHGKTTRSSPIDGPQSAGVDWPAPCQ